MRFLKKHWSNLLFLLVLILMFIPQTRMSIQVFVQRMISFSPSEISKNERVVLDDYNWKLESLNGIPKNFIASQGTVVVLNKWATWCPPCVAEMPSLQKLYDTYGTTVSFYFISDESPEKLYEFMSRNGYDFPVYLSASKAPQKLGSNVVPTTYLISEDGTIVIEKVGAANWNSEAVHTSIDRLLQ